MKKFPKAGLLIVTLVIPALIFVLLKLFATNHYDLPYYLPARNAAGETVVQNGDTVFSKAAERCVTLRPVKFDNALTVIHPLQDDCDEGCQKAIDELKRVLALKESIPELEILTITSRSQGTLKLEWRTLNMAHETVIGCLNEGKQGIAANDLILVDGSGFVRGFYKAGDTEETDRLMAEIKILDYEKKNKVN